MKTKFNSGLTVLVILIVAASLLASLSCSEKSHPSNPAENLPPTVPTAITPADGTTGMPVNTTLQWSASDPENDPLIYECYFGQDSIPSQLVSRSASNGYGLPWSKQSKAKQLLMQVNEMQLAYYYNHHNGFCLDGASTFAGDSTFYSQLGIVPELSDCYTYTMTASNFYFSCTVNSNIDDDTTSDIMRISNFAPERGMVVCISNDIDIPFRPNAIYSWQIIVQDDHGNRTSGPVWHFTTDSDTTGGNNFPAIPQLLTPLNAAWVSLDTVIFSWRCSDPDGDQLNYNVFVGTSIEDLQYPVFSPHQPGRGLIGSGSRTKNRIL